MRNVHDYLEAARDKNRLNSDSKLADMLDVSVSAVSAFRKGKAWPADETIKRLAELAGIPVEEALLELNAWRSTGETQKIYKRLIDKLNGVLTVLIIAFSSLFFMAGNADAASGTQTTKEYVNIHYHTIRRILDMVKRLFFNPFRVSFGGLR